MKKKPLQAILTGIFLLLFSFQALTQTSPVTVSTLLGYPGSLYLPDYYTAGSNKLTANLLLNDFNEPSRDVYLKISIESQNIKIYTKPDYVTTNPITLYPGEMIPYSGSDLEEYLNYNNIIIEGMSGAQLISRGGRLPEGLYTFCIEAYDFSTHRLLSNSSCQVTHLAQYDPPTLLYPTKNTAIAPTPGQNIVFQWLNNAPLDPTEIGYRFTLYELIDPYADPMQAIDNNQSLVIHQEELNTPIFNYNLGFPLLEEGKTYIYRVQSYSENGQEIFKNKGFSEPSYFHYGYPGNGIITQISPENKGTLQLTKEKVFSWSAPDNLLAGQTYAYEIKIARLDTLRTFEELLEDDSLHYEYYTAVLSGKQNYYLNVQKHFPTGEDFVWQVKAYTGEQEIAKSPIQSFGGPPCILDFIAADHYIKVISTDGCDLDNISGTGEVEVDKEGNTHPVVFNNIQLKREGAQFYLQSGSEVLADASDMKPFKLTPEYSRNGEAWFQPDSIKLTRFHYYFKGNVDWNFPHAVDQEEVPILRSDTVWLRYEKFNLLGPLPVQDSTGFDLLDPMNFRIEFTEGSRFYIRGNNNYLVNFNGNILFPESVTTLDEDSISVPFIDHEQLYNITSLANTNYAKIKVANKTELSIQPKIFLFDLDNDASPQLFKNDPLWRGFYIKQGVYEFAGDYKYSKQFASNESISVNYDFDSSDSIYAYVVNDGIWAKTTIDFKENNRMNFNTFPALIKEFSIDVQANKTIEGYINGAIEIPLLDDVDNFDFTSELTNYGFMTGYLHEDIENRTFEFNSPSEEEKLLLTFTRGYFADNERLETTVTIDWPYLDLSFENIPMFRIWGNYNIGFGSPNAAFTLARQKQTILKGYEMTIDGIGAGRQGNAYGIGTTAKMVFAEDASGDNGPPVANFYSIFESKKINEKYTLGNSPDYSNKDNSNNPTAGEANSDVGNAMNNRMSMADAEDMMAKYKRDMEVAEAQAQALIPQPKVGVASTQGDLYEEFADYIPDGNVPEIVSNPVGAMTYEEILLIIDYISPFLDAKKRKQVEQFKELLVTFSPEEIDAVIAKFSDIGKLLNGLIQNQITFQAEKIFKPYKARVDGLNNKIDSIVTGAVEKVLVNADILIDKPIDGFADIAGGLIQGSNIKNKEPLYTAVDTVALAAKKALKEQLRETVHSSVRKNITNEAKGLIDTLLYTGTVLTVIESVSQNAADFITDRNFKLTDVNIDINGIFENNKAMLERKFTLDYFVGQLEHTTDDIISGFDWNEVKNDILTYTIGGTVEAAIEGFVVDAVTAAFDSTVGGIVGGLVQAVSLDFDNLGDKIKSGDLSGIIKFDPTKIVIITPVVDLSGYVRFTKDDPIWGDSFQAQLNATIKKPIKLNAYAKFINGTKPIRDVSGLSDAEKRKVPTYKFWFMEAGVHGFSIPLTPIPLAVTGFDGKVYHHMERQEDRVTYYPNESVRFGVGAGIFLMDAGTNGKIVMFDVGLELVLLTGGFEISLDGNAAIANLSISKQRGEADGSAEAKAASDGGSKDKTDLTLSRSIVLANGFMSYNSIEKHFLAKLSATLNTAPLLCAGGGMKIDISPEWWQFAIGERINPLFIAVGCKDTIFKGWFDINKAGLDIGLMCQIHSQLRTPWANLGFAKFQGWFVFHFDFDAQLVIFWDPSFEIQKGYIFLEFMSGVGVDYKTPPLYRKTKTFTLAAINFGGILEYISNPDSYVHGEMHGGITVLNRSVNMSIEAKINL